MRDVDQQIHFLERLDDEGQHAGDELQRRGRDADLRDEDAAVELVRVDVLAEGAHLLDADVGVFEKLDPDGADGGRLGFRVGDGVFFDHVEGGVGLEGHAASAVGEVDGLVML